MNLLIISTSLNPGSRSRILAECALRNALEKGYASRMVDLRDFNLPPCDGDTAFGHPHVGELRELISSSQAILLASPVYTYSLSSSAKNLIELTGQAWTDKPVGFLAAAGGKNGYMSVLSLANALMLDFRCAIVPRFVYADSSQFDENQPVDEIKQRITDLVDTLHHWGRVLPTPKIN